MGYSEDDFIEAEQILAEACLHIARRSQEDIYLGVGSPYRLTIVFLASSLPGNEDSEIPQYSYDVDDAVMEYLNAERTRDEILDLIGRAADQLEEISAEYL